MVPNLRVDRHRRCVLVLGMHYFTDAVPLQPSPQGLRLHDQ